MVPKQGGSVLYVYTKFEADSSFRSKVIRGPKISKLGHVMQATPIQGSFYIPYAGGVRPPSLYQI